MSKPRICLIQGGMGAERDVSLVTGEGFAGALKEKSYDFITIDAQEDLPQQLAKVRDQVDVALLALHGKYAEDGVVQGICEYLKLPYTGSGVMASSVCMDKVFSKQIYVQNNISTPLYQVVDARTEDIEKVTCEMSAPVVVKPSREGSSVGITIVEKPEQFREALREARKYDYMIIIEQFIEGMELTVPVLQDRDLTPIEIAPKEGFYDYTAKYTKGKTEYHLPARLSEKTLNDAKKLARKTFEVCRIRGCARVDFRVGNDGKDLYVMEANTLPGCTPTSLVPMSARHCGIEFPDLIELFIQYAGLDYEGLK